LVYVDGPYEASEKVARASGAEVISNDKRSGKWKAIQRLIATASESDAVVLLDVGSVLEEKFFEKLLSSLKTDPSLLAVAPAYYPRNASILQSLHWIMERFLKSLENKAGGPVSVHGAAVCYRTRELMAALRFLRQAAIPVTEWLNDDVVIPFTMRVLFPKMHIMYLTGLRVFDVGVPESKGNKNSEAVLHHVRRRERMLIGNLQWLALYRYLVKRPSVSFAAVPVMGIALRRVFRIFWAHWFVCLAIAVVMLSMHLFGALAGFLSFAVLVPVILACGARDSGAAFRASLFGVKKIDLSRSQVWS
jgi:cellulose synthase/poly-beta-1,6-N-acetylglucosamine synthase-like glycosyltransferase